VSQFRGTQGAIFYFNPRCLSVRAGFACRGKKAAASSLCARACLPRLHSLFADSRERQKTFAEKTHPARWRFTGAKNYPLAVDIASSFFRSPTGGKPAVNRAFGGSKNGSSTILWRSFDRLHGLGHRLRVRGRRFPFAADLFLGRGGCAHRSDSGKLFVAFLTRARTQAGESGNAQVRATSWRRPATHTASRFSGWRVSSKEAFDER